MSEPRSARARSATARRHLVLIGGGHSHVIVLRQLGRMPLANTDVILIGQDELTPYSGMLPGFVAGHYRSRDLHIDLRALARFAGASFHHDGALAVDLASRVVACRSGVQIPYDVLSIDIGSTPDLGGPDVDRNTVVPVKPIGQFVARWEALVERLATARGVPTIGVVGAGAGGIEMLLAMQHALDPGARGAGRRGDGAPQFHLFSGASQLLPTHPDAVRRLFARVLDERRVHVHRNARVVAASCAGLTTANGEQHGLDEVVWVTQASVQTWLAQSGLAVDRGGFMCLAPTLESLSHAGVFGAGDCATVPEYPREKAGVYAVRQGPPLAANLRRALRGERLEPFAPQARALSLISTGDRYAVATRGGSLSVQGTWVWHWKDWIDRRFMAGFHDLPVRR